VRTIAGNKTTNDWDKVCIGDALRLINGRAFKPSEWRESGLPIVRIQNLNNAEAPFNYYEGDLPEKFLLNSGDLLFAWSGTPGTSFGAHIWRGGKAWLNQHIFKVLFDETDFDKKFLQLAINQNLNEYIRAAHGGAGLAHITKGRFEQSELVKPMLDIQRAIVAEIEKQFSRLDEAVANLRRVKANLKRYKASVLKAAVEGKLTEDWRKQHPAVEPAEKLLERILAERRAECDGKGAYRDPKAPEDNDLPKLPPGWIWATSLQVFKEVKDGTHDTPRYQENGVPFITQKHIKPAGLVFIDFKLISEADHKQFYRRSNPERGDILVSMIGVNRGQSCIVSTDAIFSIKNVGLFKPNHFLTSNKFLQIYFSSLVGQKLILRSSKGGAQPFIGLTELRAWPLPLPPLKEQHWIAAEVERRLSIIEELEAAVEVNLTRAARLRQSVLQQAFSGRLSSENGCKQNSAAQSEQAHAC